MITVFYDGKCGLCSKEIHHYKQIAPDGIFDWVDITISSHSLNKEGVSLSEGLKLLHAKDNNGGLYVGVDAFILIWEQLQNWQILATFVSLPVIRQIAYYMYEKFANWRFKRLRHCQLAANKENKL
jgi:predicted DCC family thiol-disulfide oxidoreductase YuxK